MITWDTGTTTTGWVDEFRITFRQLRERARDTGVAQHFEFNQERTMRPFFDVATVEYDEKEKRWEVWFHNSSVRYFNTKRSALRFVKRLEDKANGIRKKGKPIPKSLLRQKQEEEQNDYFERLGI